MTTRTSPAMHADTELRDGASWLRERLKAAGLSRVIVGLSGGIDSAVVALWAARAIGGDKVIALAMPYGLLAPARFAPSTSESLAHARLVAAAARGLEFRELDIAPTVDVEAEATGLASELAGVANDSIARLAFGNLKARVRAVRLRTFANRLGALLLGTENKSEHYLGYFTTGGDEESDLELLGDYLKAEVVQLARALGVPREIIEKAPSADLWTGQTDEDELGFTYREADAVLHLTQCATELTSDLAARCAVPLDVARRVLARVKATEFKRAAKPVYSRARR